MRVFAHTAPVELLLPVMMQYLCVFLIWLLYFLDTCTNVLTSIGTGNTNFDRRCLDAALRRKSVLLVVCKIAPETKSQSQRVRIEGRCESTMVHESAQSNVETTVQKKVSQLRRCGFRIRSYHAAASQRVPMRCMHNFRGANSPSLA